MRKIAVTGLSGVVGTQILSFIGEKDEVVDLYHTHPIQDHFPRISHVHLDLTNASTIPKILESIKPDTVIHCAARAHIDACQEEKYKGDESLAWKVNVESTAQIAQYCQQSDTRLLYLSTECVFDGSKESYNESDAVCPISWYGETKARGEEYVIQAKKGIVLRSVVAYHNEIEGKTLYGIFAKKILQNDPIQAVNDRFFAPTYTPSIAQAVRFLIDQNETGIFHYCGGTRLTGFDFARNVAETLQRSNVRIHPVSAISFFGTERATLRLKNAVLSCDRFEKLSTYPRQECATVLKRFTSV